MHKLKKLGCISCFVLLVTFSILGCSVKSNAREEIVSNGKRITLLATKTPELNKTVTTTEKLEIKKIDKYPGLRGEDWLGDDTILISKENLSLDPIRVADSMENVRNLYSYNVKTGEEKRIYNETDNMWMPIVSPDKKHILVQSYQDGKLKGIILNLDGHVITNVSDQKEVKDLYLSLDNAKWISNEEIIVPTSNNGVCIVNINSNIILIDNIGLMQTDTAEKVGDKIYYISVERNLMAYDVNFKKNTIVKENVLNFELSPNKDMFAIEKKVNQENNALVLINLDGTEKDTLIEGKSIFGISWSKDQSKIAYVLNTSEDSKNGLYVKDLINLETVYVSSDYMGIDNGLKWDVSGKKLLASIGEVKDMRFIDNAYIITLN